MTTKELKVRVLEDAQSAAIKAHAQAVADFRAANHEMQNKQVALHTAGMTLNYARIRLDLARDCNAD